MCLQLLSASPDNRQAIKLKNKIEQLVEKKNTETVDNDIKNLNHLWREEKYAELVAKLQVLYGYTPNYPKLVKLLTKAQKLLQQQQIKQTNTYISDVVAKMKSLASEKKFDEAIKHEPLLQAYIPTKPELKKVIFDIRRKYVKHLLIEKKDFLASDKYKEIIEFIEQLRQIDPTYLKTTQLSKNYRQKYLASQSNQEKEYIFQGLENLKTLFFKQKYDKTIAGAKELLQSHPNNKDAANLLKKSIAKREKIMTLELISQIETNFNNFKKQIKTNPQKFVKL